MIRWYVDKDGNKKLQHRSSWVSEWQDVPIEFDPEFLTAEQKDQMKSFIVGKKYPMRNGKSREFCNTNEEFFDIKHLLTFVDEMNHHFFYYQDGRCASVAHDMTDYDIISDTPIEEEGQNVWCLDVKEVHLNRTDEQRLMPLFVDGKQIEPRRQLDVGRLIVPYSPTEDEYYGDIHNANQFGFAMGQFDLKKQVLEAWNAGTIEKLLGSWVKE